MIIPAIIPITIHDVEEKVALVKGHVGRVQVDVADGYFAPNKTWPIINTNGFVDIVAGRSRLPFHTEIEYEIHLMVQDPMEKVNEWIAAGAQSIIAHASMLESPHLMARELKNKGVEFGIAVTPSEYEMVDDSLFELADFVQVMGSDEIGKHGVTLTNEALVIISNLATKINKPISVDIGVNADTIPKLKAAGATRFVSGSAIFGNSS